MEQFFNYVSEHWVVWVLGIANLLISWSYRKVIKHINEERKHTTAIIGGTRALLRSQLLTQYDYYCIKLKHCPVYALENIEELYLYYTQLGGNGTITQLVEKIRMLPNSEEE